MEPPSSPHPPLSYETPSRYVSPEERHQIWAERTRRRTEIARTAVLVAFAIVWTVHAAFRASSTSDENGTTYAVLFLAQIFLAFSYVVLTAIGSAARPASILPRLIAFTSLAAGCALVIHFAVGLVKNLMEDMSVYGFRTVFRGRSPDLMSAGGIFVLLLAVCCLIWGALFIALVRNKLDPPTPERLPKEGRT